MATEEEVDGTKQVVDHIVTQFLLIDKRSPCGSRGIEYRVSYNEFGEWLGEFKRALVDAFAGSDYKLVKHD